jgi:hypothetical protein
MPSFAALRTSTRGGARPLALSTAGAHQSRGINHERPIKTRRIFQRFSYLVVEGAQRVIDFLKQAFGATELRRYDLLRSVQCVRRASVERINRGVNGYGGMSVWLAVLPLQQSHFSHKTRSKGDHQTKIFATR